MQSPNTKLSKPKLARFASIPKVKILSIAAVAIAISTSASYAIAQAVSSNKPVQVASADAAKNVPVTPWAKLNAKQQQALAPLAGQWDTLEGSRQAKWLALSDRYQKATPDQQMRMQERMQAWATITPEQRKKARENYQAVRKVDPNTRAEKWSSYEQLPADKRIELHNRVEAKRQQGKAGPDAATGKTAAAVDPATNKSRVNAAPGVVDQSTLLPANKPAQPAAASTSTKQ